ncbi:MAG: hypothetical protein M4579_003069 [Chaenotheca gracillima]|nr:MAG: hypothetical protein M4579_003069 [Chaenotheca gracillima]
MASHQLAIAKAAFSAGLLRPDPASPSVSRDGIAHFHSLLENAITQCSPMNVQGRMTSLGKYLLALSRSFGATSPNPGAEGSLARSSKPSPRRKRLHVLFVLNDLLYHTKHRSGASPNERTFAEILQPFIRDLWIAAASFKECPKHQAKLRQLLSIWEEQQYYPREEIAKLQEAIIEAEKADLSIGQEGTLNEPTTADDNDTKSAPFLMPASHGDSSMPYYDLPAGNMMPHIIPNSAVPINPQSVKPIQFAPGPASEGLIMAVSDLLKDVERMYGAEKDEDEGIVADIDELGQSFVRDEITGEILGGESYYGWSRTFCERMKTRRRGPDGPRTGHRDRSTSQGWGASPRKRRRRSFSDESDSRSRSRSRRRGESLSRSRSRPRSPGRRFRSRSHRSSRSRSGGRRYRRNQSYSRSRSRTPRNSASYSPPPDRPAAPYSQTNEVPPPHMGVQGGPHFPSFAAGGAPTPPNFAMPAGFQVPPPPPSYQGAWPPPPPPLPPPQFLQSNMNMPQQGGGFPMYPGFAPPPPPPPPSMSQSPSGAGSPPWPRASPQGGYSGSQYHDNSRGHNFGGHRGRQ